MHPSEMFSYVLYASVSSLKFAEVGLPIEGAFHITTLPVFLTVMNSPKPDENWFLAVFFQTSY